MTDKPILFSAAMIRALLAQARREALEEAARISKEAWCQGYDATPHIRALIEEPGK